MTRKPGYGLGYETDAFEEIQANDVHRIAAFVLWRGGGLSMDAPGSKGNKSVAVSDAFRGPWGNKATLPFRVLLLVIFMPFALVADWIMALRKRRRAARSFVPMSAAAQSARESARFEEGVLTIGRSSFPSLAHATLVVFVEDDPWKPGELAISTHRVATEPYSPRPPIAPSVREKLVLAKDRQLKMQIIQQLGRQHFAGEGQMFRIIHEDPVCREFLMRTGAYDGPANMAR